jgi:hypothetical protein
VSFFVHLLLLLLEELLLVVVWLKMLVHRCG